MSQLIVIKKQDKEEIPVTTSKLISERVQVKHKNVIELIQTHEKRLEKFGRVAFETETLNTKGGKQETKFYFLNEQQATLLVTFMKNTDIVADFKVELVKQFFAMRQILMQKQTSIWQETRQLSKGYTKELNDTIKEFVEYARSQGSKSADKYYVHFSKLCNKTASIGDGQRDFTEMKNLRNQTLIIEIIEQILKDSMQNGMFYKDIYVECKNKVNGLLDYVPSLRLVV